MENKLDSYTSFAVSTLNIFYDKFITLMVRYGQRGEKYLYLPVPPIDGKRDYKNVIFSTEDNKIGIEFMDGKIVDIPYLPLLFLGRVIDTIENEIFFQQEKHAKKISSSNNNIKPTENLSEADSEEDEDDTQYPKIVQFPKK